MRRTLERRRLAVGALAAIATLAVVDAAASLDATRAALIAAAQLFALAAAGAALRRAEGQVTRRLFGVAMLLHGAAYLLYPAVVHAWAAGVLPAPQVWSYPVALCYALGGAGLVSGRRAREAAIAMALLLGAWVLLVRWPAVVWSPASPSAWIGLAVGAIMWGTAGLLARPGLWRAVYRSAAGAGVVMAAWGSPPDAHAQAEPAGPPVWGFVSARYSTGTAGFLFGGYGYGPAFAMVGMVNNPRSGYTEFLGGAGAQFVTGPRVSHAVALAASHATEAWYAQMYWLPTLALGTTVVEATVQAYAPLEDAGDAQLAVNPVTVHLQIAPRVSIGPVAQVALQDGIGPAYAAGAGVRLTVPAGAVTVDLLRGIRAFDHEARISFRAFY